MSMPVLSFNYIYVSVNVHPKVTDTREALDCQIVTGLSREGGSLVSGNLRQLQASHPEA